MSKSVHSPTARLLQTSRLFSLPRPLPQPPLEVASSTGLFHASETATTPYPTHQAIATPPSSHFRGDWGLKRPLPGKATRYTSTPIIRVKAQDNIQHITDFESAADHTLTERKWREMSVPMMVNLAEFYTLKHQKQSVYEDAIDNTDPDVGKSIASIAQDGKFAKRAGALDVKRWKYGGPSVAGMREGDFNLYVTKAIRSRKAEFRKFMIERLIDKRVRDEETQSRDRFARQLSAYRIQQIRKEVEQNYEVEQKRLREEHATDKMSSELTAAIYEFLDLPDDLPSGKESNFSSTVTKSLDNGTPGPRTTHPAAGLSHLRTDAVMDMHPIWGPQAERTPVLARVVRPRVTIGGQDTAAWIGVGGVVSKERATNAGFASYRDRYAKNQEGLSMEDHWLDANRMTQELDPDLPNGNKIWVQPETARIDERGNILLNTSRSSTDAIAVKTAKEEPILQATAAMYTQSPPPVAPPGTRENANFGRALPDQRQLRGRSNYQVTGFDEELKQMPGEGQRTEHQTMAEIKRIMAGQ